VRLILSPYTRPLVLATASLKSGRARSSYESIWHENFVKEHIGYETIIATLGAELL